MLIIFETPNLYFKNLHYFQFRVFRNILCKCGYYHLFYVRNHDSVTLRSRNRTIFILKMSRLTRERSKIKRAYTAATPNTFF